jgi:hypothetical protein
MQYHQHVSLIFKLRLDQTSLFNGPTFQSSNDFTFITREKPVSDICRSLSGFFLILTFSICAVIGGTSLKYYLEKVAKHHGLKFVSTEFDGSEVPGSSNEATFYVTHLREPVSHKMLYIVIVGILLISYVWILNLLRLQDR